LNVIYGIGKGFIKSNNNSNASYTAQTNPNYMWEGANEYIHPHMHQPYYYSPDMYYYYPQGYIYPDSHQAQGGRM
jgi:hypothetical protein